MKKRQVSTSEHVAAAGTDSSKSKWLILEQKFQCRQLQGSMQRTENNECYVDYFGPVSLPLFASDLNDAEEIRFLSTLMFHKHFFLFSFLFYLLEFSQ